MNKEHTTAQNMQAVNTENIKFERYPAYKDSGVEWLGEIPAHWNTLANKYVFKLKKNLVGKKHTDYDLLSLTLRGIIKRDMENPEGKFPAEFDSYQEVKTGDFVFCLFDVEETPRTVGLSPYNGMITGAYTVMEPEKSFDPKYLYYFYLNLDKGKRLRPLYRGLRNTIPKENFFSYKTFPRTNPHRHLPRPQNRPDRQSHRPKGAPDRAAAGAAAGADPPGGHEGAESGCADEG